MFASLYIERDPLRATDWAAGLVWWLQNFGGFAAAGLFLWLLVVFLRHLARGGRRTGRGGLWDPLAGTAPSTVSPLLVRLAGVLRLLFVVGIVLSFLCYAVIALIQAPQALSWLYAQAAGETFVPRPPTPSLIRILETALTLGGAFALFSVLLPFAVGMMQTRFRRIWAIARLTFLEMVRRRIFWVFAALALVFLFGHWFINPQPLYQVHSYVEVLYLSMAVLMLITGALVSSFGIPTDIRQQTIHTIVTKPVERFEIVLGRYLGYMAMLTLALLAMTACSVLFMNRGVDPDAQEESMKARVPYYGDLEFEGTKDKYKGENVGEEWDYRGYISGPFPQQPVEYAIWSINDLPPSLAQRDRVPVEFTFAIYRTTTGEVNKGVFCTFAVESWRWVKGRKDEYSKNHKQQTPELDNKLAEEYGYYELPSKEVKNYHTQSIELPAGIFKNHFATAEELRPRIEELKQKEERHELSAVEAEELDLLQKHAKDKVRPPLKIRVRCISRTQFLGMAKYDLYVLGSERPFWVNFFKGVIGIWCLTVLVVGLALSCSTYLSGVITLLAVAFLFTTGVFREHVTKVSFGANEGGGPAESLIRLFGRQNLVTPLDDNVGTRVAGFSDESYRWVMRRAIAFLPDIDLFDFSDRVANGFDVSSMQILLTLAVLAGYLLLWIVLAYYLIRSREIATW
jgi:ABC-type transport system involved in multi-copper enzyme maturation permease subunit